MDRLCERDPWYAEMKKYRKEQEMRLLIADGDFGLPALKCPCGGTIIHEVSKEQVPLGRKYLTCNKFEDDGLHIRKCWELAIEEEVSKLKKDVDEQSKKIRSRGHHEFQIQQMRIKLDNNAEEIANLKELVGRLEARMEKLFGPMG